MRHTHDLEQLAMEQRLLARTQELKLRTVAMSHAHPNCDPTAHEVLQQDLEAHRLELEDYRVRFPDSDFPGDE